MLKTSTLRTFHWWETCGVLILSKCYMILTNDIFDCNDKSEIHKDEKVQTYWMFLSYLETSTIIFQSKSLVLLEEYLEAWKVMLIIDTGHGGVIVLEPSFIDVNPQPTLHDKKPKTCLGSTSR